MDEAAEFFKQYQVALPILSEREQRVLSLRYGFDTGERRSLTEIAQEFGVSPERSRQIATKAERKVRHYRNPEGRNDGGLGPAGVGMR